MKNSFPYNDLGASVGWPFGEPMPMSEPSGPPYGVGFLEFGQPEQGSSGPPGPPYGVGFLEFGP